jgi:signal transduction histidine kinase
MSVSVTQRPRRRAGARPWRAALLAGALVLAAVAASAAALAAPATARDWVMGTAAVGWALLAVALATAGLLLRRARRDAAAARSANTAARADLTALSADTAQLVTVALPAVVEKTAAGATPGAALADVTQPSDTGLRRLLETVTTELAAAASRTAAAEAGAREAERRLAKVDDDLGHLVAKTFPPAFEALRQGRSGDTVLGGIDPPDDPRLRAVAESLIREVAVSERRAIAAQEATAKGLSRVQAKVMTMLADLREMQDKYGQEVFGDLLTLDHNASQLGLLTDRLSLLMGGRTSRAWNKPIVMESILRGAVGRIAAYRRVRMHVSSRAAITGYAAEGVMHLLAELMDNAANFSPPIEEVHVYVEERTSGIVVTIEDSGLKMSDAAMRHAEVCVSGRANDLALLQGTRLGLPVVGRLAEKFRISVNYRPSSRGGTGVVVLIPPHLVAQPQGLDQDPPTRPPVIPPLRTAADPLPAPRPAPAAPPTAAPTASTGSRPASGPRVATPGGLPVRPPGRTMAAADRDRPHGQDDKHAEEPRRPARDVGARFGAFHRSRQARPSDTDQES